MLGEIYRFLFHSSFTVIPANKEICFFRRKVCGFSPPLHNYDAIKEALAMYDITALQRSKLSENDAISRVYNYSKLRGDTIKLSLSLYFMLLLYDDREFQTSVSQFKGLIQHYKSDFFFFFFCPCHFSDINFWDVERVTAVYSSEAKGSFLHMTTNN